MLLLKQGRYRYQRRKTSILQRMTHVMRSRLVGPRDGRIAADRVSIMNQGSEMLHLQIRMLCFSVCRGRREK